MSGDEMSYSAAIGFFVAHNRIFEIDSRIRRPSPSFATHTVGSGKDPGLTRLVSPKRVRQSQVAKSEAGQTLRRVDESSCSFLTVSFRVCSRVRSAFATVAIVSVFLHTFDHQISHQFLSVASSQVTVQGILALPFSKGLNDFSSQLGLQYNFVNFGAEKSLG